MRIALVLLSLCLVLALGALGLFLALSPRQEPQELTGHTARAAPHSAPDALAAQAGLADRQDELLARMDALAREIDDLHAQVAVLKAGSEREPAAADEKPVEVGAATYAAVHRDAILQVIEDDRQAQQRKREEEQRARDLQSMLARAERTAKRFGLNQEQQKSLADVYLLERAKMEDFRTQMRDQGAFGGDPEQMRASFQELRAWRLEELTTRLGPELGQQINDSELDRFRGPDGGGGRRANRGQGGDGNGANPGGGGF